MLQRIYQRDVNILVKLPHGSDQNWYTSRCTSVLTDAPQTNRPLVLANANGRFSRWRCAVSSPAGKGHVPKQLHTLDGTRRFERIEETDEHRVVRP
jgi:hypothetical protein